MFFVFASWGAGANLRPGTTKKKEFLVFVGRFVVPGTTKKEEFLVFVGRIQVPGTTKK